MMKLCNNNVHNDNGNDNINNHNDNDVLILAGDSYSDLIFAINSRLILR